MLKFILLSLFRENLRKYLRFTQILVTVGDTISILKLMFSLKKKISWKY